MPARYHPLYDDVWSDDALDGAAFEVKAFFVFVFGNHRMRPSGIYRATDAQLVADTGLTLAKVQHYLGELVSRRRIVRDGAWIFVRGYFARQPKHQNLLAAVEKQVGDCSSVPVLKAFGEKYPHLRQWSANRLATIAQRSPNGRPTVGQPMNEIGPTEQSSTEQSSTEQSSTEQSRSISPPPPPAAPAPPRTQFRVPTSISEALDRAPKLGADPRIRTPAYWQALIRAHGGVNYGHEILKAEAWMVSNPAKAPRKNLARFLASWIGRAEPLDEEPD